jgi:tetratricopeptide (TPR) repeat protein
LNQLEPAHQTLQKLNALTPAYGRCHQEIGHCYKAQNQLAQALSAYLKAVEYNPGLLVSCVVFEPDNVFARFDYVQVLHKRQKFTLAYEQASKLSTHQPDKRSFANCYANQCVAVGKFDKPIAIYKTVEKTLPDNPHIPLVMGHAYTTIGEHSK